MLARCWGSVPFEEVIQNTLVMVCGSPDLFHDELSSYRFVRNPLLNT